MRRQSRQCFFLNPSAQASYLEWVEDTGLNGGELEPCDDCSSDEISLASPFPFGNYYHNSIYVSNSYNSAKQIIIESIVIIV